MFDRLHFLIIAILGSGALLGTAGIILLTIYGKEPPQTLVATVSLCYGALSSFLVTPPSNSDNKPKTGT